MSRIWKNGCSIVRESGDGSGMALARLVSAAAQGRVQFALPQEEQMTILREHGKIGHGFGEAGFAHDIRLACFGMDQNDNDFVIGLVGEELFPLSACIQAMRRTQQTSHSCRRWGRSSSAGRFGRSFFDRRRVFDPTAWRTQCARPYEPWASSPIYEEYGRKPEH